MKWTHPSPNSTELVLDTTETLHVRGAVLRSRLSGMRLVPRWPHRSIIARILSGFWLLDELNGATTGDQPITLIGRSPVSRARVVQLTEGQSAAVHLHALQGVVLPHDYDGPPMATWFSGLFKPGYWMIGSPLPVVFEGPLHLLLSADGLTPEPDANTPTPDVLRPDQLIVWDVRADLEVCPQDPVNKTAAVANGLTFRSWVKVPDDAAPLVVLDYSATRPTHANLAPWVGRHLLVGVLLSILIIYAADWIIQTVLPLLE